MLIKFLKSIFSIYKNDVKKIATNWVSCVIIAGVVLLPSLYAWINIYASWDPYGNTEGIKVGIVNEDKGSNFKDMDINIGKEVADNLKENKSLGWTFFTSKEEGFEQVNKGKVYATIVIPSDFSSKMLTLLDEKPDKPKLEYYVNEKINAIAPKITDKGATTIQHQITTAFIETVADKILEIMKEAGIEADKEYETIEKLGMLLVEADKRFPEINDELNKLTEQAENGKVFIGKQGAHITKLQGIIGDVIAFDEEASKVLLDYGISAGETIPKVREDLILAQTIFSDISNSTLTLKQSIEVDKPLLIKDIDSSISKIENIKQRLDQLVDKAVRFDKEAGDALRNSRDRIIHILDEYIKTLEILRTTLDQSGEVATDALGKIQTLNANLSKEIGKLVPLIQQSSKTLDTLLGQLQTLAEKLESLNPPKNYNDQVFVKELDETLEVLSAIRQNRVLNNGNFEGLKSNLEQIDKAIENILQGEKVENQALAFNELKAQSLKLSVLIQNLQNNIQGQTESLIDKVYDLQELTLGLSEGAKSLGNMITSASDETKQNITQIILDIEALEDKLDSTVNTLLKTSNQNVLRIAQAADDIKSDLSKLKRLLLTLQSNLENKTIVEDTLGNISQLTYNIGASLENVINKLDDNLVVKLQEKSKDFSIFFKDINGLLGGVQTDLEDLKTFSNKLTTKESLLVTDVQKIQEKLPSMQKKLDNLVAKMDWLNEKVDFKKVINQATMDNSDKSDFLASPVILDTHVLFPMANYGTALTPFYTTLCLWVGALILCALLTTKAKNATLAYTPVEEYFGKYLLFATLAALQGLIAACGDLFILGVVAKQPVLFVSLAIFYSIVFTGIVYTLVSLFGNVGKGIGVVFLVLQLAGAGGTFPVQVMPPIFQQLNKFLPFTYAIEGMREAIAGVVYETLIVDILALLVFYGIFICLGILLKKKANNFLHRFAKQLVKSGVIEH